MIDPLAAPDSDEPITREELHALIDRLVVDAHLDPEKARLVAQLLGHVEDSAQSRTWWSLAAVLGDPMAIAHVSEVLTPAPQRWINRMRLRFFCGFMGLHPRGRLRAVAHDGCSTEARCERCGYVGLIDSQGNLF